MHPSVGIRPVSVWGNGCGDVFFQNVWKKKGLVARKNDVCYLYIVSSFDGGWII